MEQVQLRISKHRENYATAVRRVLQVSNALVISQSHSAGTNGATEELTTVKSQLTQLQQEVRKQRKNGGKGDRKGRGKGRREGHMPDTDQSDEPPKKKAACFKWNVSKPCANDPCTYAHVCSKCGDAGHKRPDCSK